MCYKHEITKARVLDTLESQNIKIADKKKLIVAAEHVQLLQNINKSENKKKAHDNLT